MVVVPPSAAFVGSPNGATSLIGEAGARLVSVDAVRALVAWWRAVEALAYALVCVRVCVSVSASVFSGVSVCLFRRF